MLLFKTSNILHFEYVFMTKQKRIDTSQLRSTEHKTMNYENIVDIWRVCERQQEDGCRNLCK